MNTKRKTALNTLALYVNMIVSMLANLLITRLALDSLGDIAYGVYMLSASIIAALSFLTVAMAGATQRFMSFYSGKNDMLRQQVLFSTSVYLHFFISICVLLLLIVTGTTSVFFLKIPPELHTDAILTVLCMSLGVFVTVNAVPYEASINAHEDIYAVGLICSGEAVLKLGATCLLPVMGPRKMVFYALSILVVTTIGFLARRLFSRIHYPECKVRGNHDPAVIRQMLSFAGWNLFGVGSSIIRYQGIAFVINPFFGVVSNAAYGVAQQLNGFLMFFANSTTRPLRPIVIKAEGSGHHQRMVQLSMTTTKMAYLLLFIPILPLYYKMPFILSIWLRGVPQGALGFCRSFLIITLISQLTIGLQIAIEGGGRIKRQQIVLGIMHLFPLPLGYIAYKNGAPMNTILELVIAEEVINIALRLYISQKDADVNALMFLKKATMPCVLISAATALITLGIVSHIQGDWAQLFTSCGLCMCLVAVLTYLFALSPEERDALSQFFAKKQNGPTR